MEYMERFDSAYDAVKAICIQNIPTENKPREPANKGKAREEHLTVDRRNTRIAEDARNTQKEHPWKKLVGRATAKTKYRNKAPNLQGEVELVFRVHTLQAAVGDTGIRSLLKAILDSELLEVCSEQFDRVIP